jgi:hypothetical protein
MNRSAGNGHRLAAGEGRTARLAVSPGGPEPAATTLLQARHREGARPGAARKHRDPVR